LSSPSPPFSKPEAEVKITRSQAAAQGLLRYFGKACSRHPELAGERQTLDAHCPECRRAKNLASYQRHGEVRRAHTRKVYHADIEQSRAKGRAQSVKHRERILAYGREWRAANKERCAAVNRAWAENNRERMEANQREWYEANKAHVAASGKLRRAANKDVIAARAKAWRQENKAHWKAMMANRRGRERAAPGRFTKDDVQRMWDAQVGICAAPACTTSLEVSCTVDHMTPLSRGGSNWPVNLQLLCKPCNCSKGTKTMDEWICIGEAA
jgi:5-methylcytosine-specific restriction endonuclease McrA